MVVLSDTAPVRGSRGAIVRCLDVRTTGFTVFVAADAMHDRPPPRPATPVELSIGR